MFLEAIYIRKPIVVNTYAIYKMDIQPKVFSVRELDEYVTNDAVEQTRKVLTNSQLQKDKVDINYELGKKYFSYKDLRIGVKRFAQELGIVPVK